MRLKDTLNNIVTMLEVSSLENQKLKEEVLELKAKINVQQAHMTVFSQKLLDLNETNVEAMTLIEELANHIMESSTSDNNIVKKISTPTKLYLVGK